MNTLSFYIEVVCALEEIEAPYMIVGAFAASAYGLTRSTHDIDILVDLRWRDCDALAARFPPPRYYADPEQMRNSMQLGMMFNIIDTALGIKADLVPITREPEYRAAFTHRRRCTLVDASGAQFEAWCARPEDVIVGKLMAWQEGRSAKHPSDIRTVLVFMLSGLAGEPFDVDYVTRRVLRIGPETAALWQQLLDQARADIATRPPA
jgi:hypothetical protein